MARPGVRGAHRTVTALFLNELGCRFALLSRWAAHVETPIAVLLEIHFLCALSPEAATPCRHGGRPCVRQMRITVAHVLGWLAAGMTHQEILSDYPELTEEDIRACLSYAADRERGVLIAA